MTPNAFATMTQRRVLKNAKISYDFLEDGDVLTVLRETVTKRRFLRQRREAVASDLNITVQMTQGKTPWFKIGFPEAEIVVPIYTILI